MTKNELDFLQKYYEKQLSKAGEMNPLYRALLENQLLDIKNFIEFNTVEYKVMPAACSSEIVFKGPIHTVLLKGRGSENRAYFESELEAEVYCAMKNNKLKESLE